MLIPIWGSSEGSGASSGRDNVNLWRMVAKKMKSSILAKHSPIQLRVPEIRKKTVY